MYGTTVFEYFQSMRMQKSPHTFTHSKIFSKTNWPELGYSNMSNFTIAFKKEFNQLPHDTYKIILKLSFTVS